MVGRMLGGRRDARKVGRYVDSSKERQVLGKEC